MSSSFPLTRIAFALLLYCACNGGASARTRNRSMHLLTPTTMHQKTKENSTLLRKLLLPEKDKDRCLQESTYHERADCLLPLLETYYGRYFTVSCPGFSLVLARSGCTGCPWSRINPDRLREIGKRPLPLKPSYLYFRNVTPACRIAQHAKKFISYKSVFFRVGFLGMYIAFTLAIISFWGDRSGSEDGKTKTVIIDGMEVSEVAYLGVLWGLFYSLNFYLAFTDDYYRHCESLSSYFAQYMLKIAAYITTLFISMSRCLRLRHRETSILSFVRILLMSGLFVAVIFDQFALFYASNDDLWCFIQKDYAMGLIQYLKLLLEFLAVITFVRNTRSEPSAERRRYACLTLILLLSWVVIGLCVFTDIYKPRGHSMLIPHILDQEIAGVGVQLVHINVISLFGLLEQWIPSLEQNTMADTESSSRLVRMHTV